MTNLSIRFAKQDDVPEIKNLITELARFEKLEHEVVATEALLTESLFGPKPSAEVLMGEVDGQVVGFALFFENYSTFLARKGLYLEDLFVRPEFRSRGYGKIFLAKLAEIALERNAGRLDWWVLDWNQKAIDFYESIGAKAQSDWTVYRLNTKEMKTLVSDSGLPSPSQSNSEQSSQP